MIPVHNIAATIRESIAHGTRLAKLERLKQSEPQLPINQD
jgi:hypothetical protein